METHEKFEQILDEAELKYVETSTIPPANQEEEMMVYNAFKAGVKWMAEQGVTIEKTVDRTPLNGPNGVTVFLYDFDGFQPGDKVIVQIRKKEK